MWRYLKRLVIGKPLKTMDEGGQALTKFKALALLSSDALSSVAYGTALGLNDPWWQQYLRWLGQIVQGDFGESILYAYKSIT